MRRIVLGGVFFGLVAIVFCTDADSPSAPSSTGSPLWSYQLDSRSSGPLAVGPHVYIREPGSVVVLHSDTGERAWTFAEGEEGFAQPNFIVSEGTVVVSWKGRLHGFRANGGGELWINANIPTRYSGDPSTGEPTDFLVSDGSDGVYVSNSFELARVDQMTGETIWRTDLTGTGRIALAAYPLGVCVRSSPVVTVRCYDKAKGAVLWSSGQIQIAPPGSILILDSRVILDIRDTWIALDVVSGDETWRTNEHPPLRRATGQINNVIYACDENHGCEAVSTQDGRRLWRADLTNPLPPAASESFLFVIDVADVRPDVQVIDPTTGIIVDSIQTSVASGFRFPPSYGQGILLTATSSDLLAYRYPRSP